MIKLCLVFHASVLAILLFRYQISCLQNCSARHPTSTPRNVLNCDVHLCHLNSTCMSRRNFSDRIETLHSQIDTVIMNDIDREIQSNVQRINDCIAPYSRFIDSEKSKLSKALVALKSLRKTTRDIQNKLK
jgi:hypothetical protein